MVRPSLPFEPANNARVGGGKAHAPGSLLRIGGLASLHPTEAAPRAERRLARLAFALTTDRQGLTQAEHSLVAETADPPTSAIELARRGILDDGDPLGEAFCAIRSPADRRTQGAVYTPFPIIRSMLEWAAEQVTSPARIVDPGAGSGRFIAAAAMHFPEARLHAVEIDPLAALLVRAVASVRGFADRLTVHVEDYRALVLPPASGPTLFVGNPPYIRHHNISEEWKTWFGEHAALLGFKASKLAGTHIHFFLKTRELAHNGDVGTFLTSAEWLDVNYGAFLRRLLANDLGGVALHVFDPKVQPFGETLTTGAITCFRVGSRPRHIIINLTDRLDRLVPLKEGRQVAWSDLNVAPRWSFHVRQEAPRGKGLTDLGELFRVHRGQVTGANAVWIENLATVGLPDRYFHPTITRARELIVAGDILRSVAGLRRVLDLPVDLGQLAREERIIVQRFLATARRAGADQGYIAAHRRAWWAVGLRSPAPILCTYMARGAPTFVQNVAGARHLNIAHGLYPRGHLSANQLAAITHYLRRNATLTGGRVYAGGLIKFEPRELERIPIPALDRIHEYAEALVPPGVAVGRRDSTRLVPA